MSLKLFFHRTFIPARVKRETLKELVEFTAYAFQCAAPQTAGLSHNEALHTFARFCSEEADKAVSENVNLNEVKARLFENARLLGKKLRAQYRLKTLGQAFKMARIIFRILRIDFKGDRSGEIVVRRCFFSARFSKEVCEIVSNFDEGLLAGLSGGGVLTFLERITDCSACCRARFVLKDESE